MVVAGIFITALVSAILTHELSLKKNWGAIRASSFLTLVFVFITTVIHFKLALKFQLVFLGGSFVGMSDPQRLTRLQIASASFIFAFIFIYFIKFLAGMGGALGLSAFLSCLIVTSVFHTGRKMKTILRKRPRKNPSQTPS